MRDLITLPRNSFSMLIPNRRYKILITVTIVVIALASNLSYRFAVHRVSLDSMRETYCDGDLIVKRRTSKKNWINRNDVIIIDLKNIDPNSFPLAIKRCLAMPGDTLRIDNGNLYVNEFLPEIPNSVLHQVEAISDDFGVVRLIDSIGFGAFLSKREAYGSIKICLSVLHSKLGLLSIDPRVTIKMIDFENHEFTEEIIRKYSEFVLPSKGSIINLPENFEQYEDIMINEGHTVVNKDGRIYIDGILSTHYKFLYNYFFAVGDNRANSHDSRDFGAIREEYINGKVICKLSDNKIIRN